MNAAHLVVFFRWEELQPIAVYSQRVDRLEVSACQTRQQRLENVSGAARWHVVEMSTQSSALETPQRTDAGSAPPHLGLHYLHGVTRGILAGLPAALTCQTAEESRAWERDDDEHACIPIEARL